MNDSREIIIIAAMAQNRVIGKNNALPWSIKADMARFKVLTTGWPCIMGRKTWDSLPRRPLPGRLNIIVSGSMKDDGPHLTAFGGMDTETAVCASLSGAVEYCANYQKVFICGGASIYRQAMDIANRIELTLLRRDYEGDTFFPEIDPARWSKANTDDFDTFSFISYTKKE
ncbi:MAG: dihydrofolate reductase [Treponema sp.]|jgi:dihydrofolate reductase|nr:dihydrofolate reductase [Treponema sp.]